MSGRHSGIGIIPLLLALAIVPSRLLASDPAATIINLSGDLPLLLTVPHDGQDPLGTVPVRTKGALTRDAGTRELAEKVATTLQERTGKRPYVVIAKFSRKHLDANRPEAEAMESDAAMPAYRAYHAAIARYVAEIRERFPAGSLLVDVHGQSEDPDTAFRGTRGGRTTAGLLKRFGPDAIQGERSIIGILAARGYRVHPPPSSASLDEDRRFAGGYTVFTYGSNRPDGIDAIQLEFGRNQRSNPRLAADFADALLLFMREYGMVGW